MLHKTSFMRGFHLLATDGEVGHVDDFLIDDTWTVRHLVADTSNWLVGQAVLIAPSSVDKIDSPGKKIRLRLSRDEVKNSPSVDTADIELIETLPRVPIL